MRWIFRIIGAVLLLVALALGALFLIPSERIAKIATDQFTARTGRALAINGQVRPTLWPQIGVRAEGVRLDNAPWSDQGPMVQADAISVGVDVMALLGGTVQVERLELLRPQILLERAADGRVNWDLSRQGAAPAVQTPDTGGTAKAGVPPFSLALAQVQNGAITYIDRGTDQMHSISALDLTLRLPGLDQTAQIEGGALYREAAVTFGGSVTSVRQLVEGALADLDLRLEAGGTSVALAGKAGLTPLGFQGRIDLDSRERAQVFQALGQAAPDLPKGLGRDSITLQSGLTLASEGSVHLRDMVLGLDDNRITGALDLIPGAERPKVVANLQSGGLNLIGLSQKGSGGTASAPAAQGWSAAPIDVSALGLVDADITLETGAIELGDARLEGVSTQITLDAARAVALLRPIRLYGGQIAGEVVVNGRNGLSSRAALSLKDLALQPLLTQFVDFDRLVGTAEGQIDVLAVGNSLRALMQSLEGRGNLAIGRGELLGLDIGGMLRNLDAGYRGEGAKTIFDGITASFDLAGGALRNTDLRLIAPLLTASGAGVVGIGAQDVDYRIEPVALSGADGAGGIRVPVTIRGPWSNLSFRPDLSGAIGERLGVNTDELRQNVENSAKDKLRDSLSKELEAAPETLNTKEDAKDAVKDRLKNEIDGALRGILGGN